MYGEEYSMLGSEAKSLPRLMIEYLHRLFDLIPATGR
jgi:hypothetical protein